MDPNTAEEQKAVATHMATHVEIHETPLNWPLWKRNTIFFVVCLTALAATNTILANAAGLVIQAHEFQKSAQDLSYTLSATLVGAAVGPFVWQPFARRFGKASTIFTASNLLWIFNIWAAVCRSKSSYGSFIGARTMSGFASSAAAYVGGPFILELYPLHNRGKAFGFWSFSLMFGTIFGPAMSGYIVYYVPWPVQFWYNVGLNVFIVILMLIVFEETGVSATGSYVCLKSESWFTRRRYLIPGLTASRYRYGARDLVRTLTVPWLILICPHALIASFGLFVYFGFAAGITNVLAVFLQTPISHGGYGLSAKENSNFLFSQWAGTLLALVYSTLLGDRLPLWLYKRNGGTWKPEYRLVSLLLPCLVLFPIGYVVMGISLARHYNLAILGLAASFLAGATVLVTGSLIAYLTETFLRYRSEANVTANLTRLALAIAIPFFVFPWEEKVGLEWMFGMIGIFQWACFVPLLVLYFKGETIRMWALSSVADVADEEAGETMVNGGH